MERRLLRRAAEQALTIANFEQPIDAAAGRNGSAVADHRTESTVRTAHNGQDVSFDQDADTGPIPRIWAHELPAGEQDADTGPIPRIWAHELPAGDHVDPDTDSRTTAPTAAFPRADSVVAAGESHPAGRPAAHDLWDDLTTSTDWTDSDTEDAAPGTSLEEEDDNGWPRHPNNIWEDPREPTWGEDADPAPVTDDRFGGLTVSPWMFKPTSQPWHRRKSALIAIAGLTGAAVLVAVVLLATRTPNASPQEVTTVAPSPSTSASPTETTAQPAPRSTAPAPPAAPPHPHRRHLQRPRRQTRHPWTPAHAASQPNHHARRSQTSG